MKHSLFILPLALTLSSLTSHQVVNASPQNRSVAGRNTPTANTTERNKALVLKWSDLLRGNNRDLAAAQALVTDDWVIHGAGPGYSKGPEGLKQWQGYIDAMWANTHFTEDDIFAESDKVVRRITVYRTWKSNNKESAMTVVFIYRIADGKIAEVWRAADALTSYQQIGAQIIMPGTNVDVGQPTSLPARPETVAEQKSSSDQKTSQSNKVVGNTDTAKRETPSAGTTESNKVLVARWADAIWNKDLAVAQALVTDDWVIHGAGSNYPKGPEGVKQWQGDVDPNWNYGGSMTDDVIAEGDKAARRTTVFAMYKPNHRGTVTPVIFIYRIAEGKIAEVWRVANYVSTYMQAGARIIMPGAKADAGQAMSAKTEAEQEVLKGNEEFNDAIRRNDADARARFYADDYVLVRYDGTLSDKAKQLEMVRSGLLHYSDLRVEDEVPRVFGDTAVVIDRRKQTVTVGGQPRPSDVRDTNVWVKREVGWRLVSTSVTPVLEPVPGPSLPGPAAGQTPGTKNSVNEPVQAAAEPEIPNGASQAEREVLKASNESAEATRRNDADALARIYGDDYLFVVYNGSLSTKEIQLESLRSGFMKFSAATTEDIAVRVYGDTAVVIKRRKQVATVGARTTAAAARVTQVWVQRQGRWQLVSGQVTPILEPASAPTGADNVSTPGETRTMDDEAAIRKIVAENTDAWNRRDAKALAAHGSEDHDHINVAGAWRQGKLETEKALTAFFETHRSNPVSNTPSIERIRFITPEVAILVTRNKYANDKKAWEAISISVFHKMDGEWWNEAFQNTLVQSREEAIAQAARASSPMAQTEPEVLTPANSKIDFSGDVAAIRKMVADSVDAWNRRDPKAVTAHGSENHDHINVIGAWRQGKAESEKAMTAALATTRNNISSSIAKIRFITPDVAIVIVRHQYTNDKEALKSISTSVLHKMNGEWWNEAFQNTYVQPR